MTDKQQQTDCEQGEEPEELSSLALSIIGKGEVLAIDYAILLGPDHPLVKPQHREDLRMWFEQRLAKVRDHLREHPDQILSWAAKQRSDAK